MRRDPRDIHTYEQLQARLEDVAKMVAAYRRELMAGGVPEPEAWASAQRVEARLADMAMGALEERELGRMFDDVMRAIEEEGG